MDPFVDTNWDLIDYNTLINDVVSTDLYWGDQSGSNQVDASLTSFVPLTRDCRVENECTRNSASFDVDATFASLAPPEECVEKECTRKSTSFDIDASFASLAPPEECVEKECTRKRARSNTCSRAENKACRERQRRELLNNRFLELSSTLEPDRPATTDKLAILGDAIRVLNQLKSESQDCKEMNEKLLEEIKTLKAEKNELREEKLVLKAEKAKIEQQVKSMTNNLPPPGYMTPHPAAYQAGAGKMPVFPGYGYIPMWQYLPQSSRDTTHDHELRPPAA